MILDYGTPGSGVIERTVLDQQGSPYSRVSTWTGSPDNPANYTLHYQSGNLNSIANAEGWGVYSENSFLTGKLLVGDLTKAGQYMEYANGELNIKGKITVTGGNAATKADVDAAIDNIEIGGRNLIPVNTDIWESGTIASATGDNGASTARLRTIEYIDAESNQDYFLSIYSDNKIALLAYDSTGEYIGFLGSQTWITDSVLLKTPSNTARLRFVLAKNDDSTIGLSDLPYVKIKLELGNRATDWTPAPEDVTAEIAAAETSAKGYADGAAASAESAAKTFATAEANAALTAAKGHSDTLKTRVETRLGLAQLEDINETLITGGKVRTALLEATEIKSLLITAENIEGLTLDFDKGTIGGWDIAPGAIANAQRNLRIQADSGFFVSPDALTSNPYASNNRVSMYYYGANDWGLSGREDGNFVFQLGSTNKIGGFSIDSTNLTSSKMNLSTVNGVELKRANGTVMGRLSHDVVGGTDVMRFFLNANTSMQLDAGGGGNASVSALNRCRIYGGNQITMQTNDFIVLLGKIRLDPSMIRLDVESGLEYGQLVRDSQGFLKIVL